MEIIPFQKLGEGDIILINGTAFENECCVVTVDSITQPCFITSLEFPASIYSFGNDKNKDVLPVVRLVKNGEEGVITIMCERIKIALTNSWRQRMGLPVINPPTEQ